jgi:hypothetical protein
MINLFTSIIVGIVSGFIASYLFLMYFLKRKKPKIEISKHISKQQFRGETNYFFKFVNKTKSEIYDVRVEATFYKPVGDIVGRNLQGTDIELKDCLFMYIPCSKNDDKHNLHAMRIRTINDLGEQWKDDSSFIRLTIMAKHSLSGLNQVFSRDFHNKDCITSKKFVSGDDLSVK